MSKINFYYLYPNEPVFGSNNLKFYKLEKNYAKLSLDSNLENYKKYNLGELHNFILDKEINFNNDFSFDNIQKILKDKNITADDECDKLVKYVLQKIYIKSIIKYFDMNFLHTKFLDINGNDCISIASLSTGDGQFEAFLLEELLLFKKKIYLKIYDPNFKFDGSSYLEKKINEINKLQILIEIKNEDDFTDYLSDNFLHFMVGLQIMSCKKIFENTKIKDFCSRLISQLTTLNINTRFFNFWTTEDSLYFGTIGVYLQQLFLEKYPNKDLANQLMKKTTIIDYITKIYFLFDFENKIVYKDDKIKNLLRNFSNIDLKNTNLSQNIIFNFSFTEEDLINQIFAKLYYYYIPEQIKDFLGFSKYEEYNNFKIQWILEFKSLFKFQNEQNNISEIKEASDLALIKKIKENIDNNEVHRSLNNCGQICYFNSLLQMFSYMPEFLEELIKYKDLPGLLPEQQNIFNNLINVLKSIHVGQGIYDPLTEIQTMNIYPIGEQQDVNDTINEILNKINLDLIKQRNGYVIDLNFVIINTDISKQQFIDNKCSPVTYKISKEYNFIQNLKYNKIGEDINIQDLLNLQKQKTKEFPFCEQISYKPAVNHKYLLLKLPRTNELGETKNFNINLNDIITFESKKYILYASIIRAASSINSGHYYFLKINYKNSEKLYHEVIEYNDSSIIKSNIIVKYNILSQQSYIVIYKLI